MHSRSHTRFVIALALLVAAIGALAAQDVSLPNQPDSLKFAIIGDSGTGSSSQYKVAEKLIAARPKFPYGDTCKSLMKQSKSSRSHFHQQPKSLYLQST